MSGVTGATGAIVVGQLVYSKRGRDKGGLFVVISAAGDYVYISDGATRKLSSLKKKKLKHVQPVNYIDRSISGKISQNAAMLDADIRRALSIYKNREVINFVEK